MKHLSVLLTLAASCLLAGHLNAQTFRNPLRIPTSQDPISVFTVDMNGDGIPDLLYETEGHFSTPSSMNVFFGNSSGGFDAGPTFTLPTDVGGCRPADANRDGNLDLVCLHLIDEFDVEIATFLGNGDGTFQAHIFSAPMQSQVGYNDFVGWLFTPADVNGDGIPDLFVGDEFDGWIFVLLGDGSGRFTVKSVLGGYPTSDASGFSANAGMSITVADINGDGRSDLLFSNGPTILLGNGDGTFQAPATYVGSYFSCVYRDMDGDGHLDAICANTISSNGLAILHGNANGSFNTTPISTQTFISSDLPEPVDVVDLNGDGIADILAYSSDGLEVLLGEPGLKFAAPVHYAVGYPASNGAQSSQLADMNQDGQMDVVAAGPNGIYISYGSGDGTFNAPPAYEVAQVLGHATVADFNGDGIPDIAATGDQSIELSLGNGDGTFKPYVILPNDGIDFSDGGSGGDAQIVHGDFRGNGKQDILAIGSPGTYVYNSYILFGNGDGTFAGPELVPGSSVIRPAFDVMDVLDINKDGRDDVLTIDSTHINSALSNGDGTFTTVSTTLPANPSTMNPSFPSFADFNHDGKLDAAYGLPASIQILKGHGDGTFDSTGVSLPIPNYMGQNPLSSTSALVTTGDFDGDGNPDIAALVEVIPEIAPWTNQTLTLAYVYYGKGDGTFTSPLLAGAFNREYSEIFAADVNKDGLTDLIFQTNDVTGFLNAPSGDGLGVLLSKPGRVFGPEVNDTGGQTESGLIVEDLNGDGYPDLLAINSGFFPNGDYLSMPGNTVTVLLNLGAQTSLIPSTTSLTSSSNPAAVGASITFTATVISLTSGKGAPTGTVTFADQSGIHASQPLVAISGSASTATFTTNAIGIGSDAISATYSGDAVFTASSASISQTVTGDPTTIAFTAVPNPAIVSQTVTLTVTVANPAGNSVAAPTGSVTFTDGVAPIAGPIVLAAGTATYNATFAAAGLHALTTAYSGDTLHGATTATLNERILASPPGNAGPKEWVWMGGSSTARNNCNQSGDCGQPGVYGTLGTPSAQNIPGARFGASTWTDSSGNLWMFGGDGFDGNGVLGELNDLWEFNPAGNQWTWMGGSSVLGGDCAQGNYCGASGVYGTLYTPAPGNIPGSRSDGARWTDGSGNLWLFGGFGYDASGYLGYLNDLWEFSPSTNQWAWMGGKPDGEPAVYGIMGTAAPGNIPGSRSNAVSWVDSKGQVWLFSGLGSDANGILGYLNDLWEYDPSTKLWAWMGGSSTIGSNCGFEDNCGQPGVYGTLGTPAAGNIPGGRQAAAAWTDSSGHLWLFGGFGFDGKGGWSALNDLWELNSSTALWTWMGGSSTIGSDGAGQPNVFGVLGVPAPGNQPGGHYDSADWVDGIGHLWFFGGVFDVVSGGGNINDQWEFNPTTNQWTWWGGGQAYQGGIYGTLGVPAPGNFPGGRSDAMAWTDSSGNPWLFGGGGYDANEAPGTLNDLWTYQAGASLPSAATPTFSPAAGSYAAAQTVTISDITPGAIIYYTTNGTAPNINSAVYTAPIALSSTETIEAMATAAGYANSSIATADYTIAASAVATTTSLTASAMSLTAGQTLTLTAKVEAASGATPAGMVSFYNGITLLGSATLNTSGTATLTLTPAVGTYSITASYAGSTTDAASSSTPPITVTVGLVATGTTLVAAPTTLTAGQTLTLTATVTAASGSAPSGTVTFLNGTASLGTAQLNAAGVATLTLTPAVGTYSITASYGGSSTDAPSVSSPAVAVAVNTIATTTVLTASSNTLTYGQTLTLTATVTPAGGATPAGMITFYNGAVSLGTASLNGSGVATLALTPAFGSYSITASYGGSASDAASTSAPIAISVIASATTTMLTVSPNPAPFGASVTFTATVSGPTAMPAGSVAFYDGSALLATATLAAGVANYSTSALTVGSHNITATFAGATGFNTSTSNEVVEIISPADFSISASPAAQTIYAGEATSFSVTITPGTGFNLPVALSCTQAPANTNCTFSSSIVSAGSGNATLTVQTTAPSNAATASALSKRVGIPMLAGFLLLIIPRRIRRFRNRWPTFLALVLSIALAASITGCSAPGQLTGGTPVGVQTMTLTGVATNGSQTLTHATTVTLNVKSIF